MKPVQVNNFDLTPTFHRGQSWGQRSRRPFHKHRQPAESHCHTVCIGPGWQMAKSPESVPLLPHASVPLPSPHAAMRKHCPPSPGHRPGSKGGCIFARLSLGDVPQSQNTIHLTCYNEDTAFLPVPPHSKWGSQRGHPCYLRL